jgi:hypothetical protein
MRTVQGMAIAAAFVVSGMTVSTLAEPRKYGTGVTLEQSTPIPTLLARPADFAGKTVRVEGTVAAVCSHEGCWMALSPEGQPDGPTLRLKVDDGVIVFPVTAKGKKAVAEGVMEQVGADPEAAEAAGEHAKHSRQALAEASKNWQIKATGALVY